MKKSKKNLMIVLSSLLMLGMVSSCSLQGPKGDKGDQGIAGLNGSDGKDGKDGATPYIGSNGNWWIGSNDTGIAAQGPQGEKGDKGEAGKDGVSIVGVTKASSADGVDTYVIQYSDGTTGSFVVTNGKDGSQGVQGVPGKDGHTPAITVGENGHWFVDGADTGYDAQGPKGDKGDKGEKGDKGDTGAQGPQGDKGDIGSSGSTPTIGDNGNWWIDDVDTGVRAEGRDASLPYVGENGDWWVGSADTGVPAKGNGIVSIELTSTDGRQKTYTITFSDSTTFTFAIADGKDGTNGKDGHTPTIGDNGDWYINGTDTGVKAKAVSISSIQKKSSNGNIDTYEVTLSNGETYEFTVTNGTNGDTPYIGSNGNWWISGADTGVKAQGPKGDKGDKGEKGDKGDAGAQGPQGEKGDKGDKGDTGAQGPKGDRGETGSTGAKGDTGAKGETGDTGKSAYEIYCEEHPDYKGSEEDWLKALANGDLADDITITVDTNGGDVLNPIKCRPNSYIEVTEPKRQGYVFDGWYLNGSPIDINTYLFRVSCTIVAHYRSASINVTLDANDGDVSYNKTTIEYGSTYSLPTPTKKYQTFDGWYYGSKKVANTGKWAIKDDCTLTAKWNKKEITVTLSVDSSLGSCSASSAKLNAGDKFALPVPSASTDATFQGWFYGETQLTDATGTSLGTLDFDSDIILNAKFYTEINNVYQILAMSNSDSTTGNYRVTKDLDFDGIDMSPIEDFSGVFDGGGHKLSNINLVNGKGEYGGFFGTISRKATIKNIDFYGMESSGTWSTSGGLIGNVEGERPGGNLYSNMRIEDARTNSLLNYSISLSNVAFENSFNDSALGDFGLFVGRYYNSLYGSIYPSLGDNLSITNLKTTRRCVINATALSSLDSLKSTASVKSFFIGENALTIINADSSTEKEDAHFFKMMELFYSNSIDIDNYRLMAKEEPGYSYQNTYGLFGKGVNNYRIAKPIIGADISHLNSSLSGLECLVMPNSLAEYVNVDVCDSSNYGSSTYAWGGVRNLTNCINTSESSYWGAKNSTNCIDAAVQDQSYDYDSSTKGVVTNCVSLIPDGNGVYKYYNSASSVAEVKKASLINKDFFVSLLKFDESVWNFDELNIIQKQYPKIRG